MASLKKQILHLLAARSNEHEPDYLIIVAVAVITVFGLIMLSSATSAVAYIKLSGNSYYFFKHQLVSIILGIIALIFFSKMDYHLLKKYGFYFLLASVVMLLLVFIPGLSAHYGKARSWINIFGWSLQPSEFVKLSFLIYLAAWLERRGKQLKDIYQGIGPFVIVLGFISILMVLQPDLGTLSIIGATSLLVYFVGGGGIRHIIWIILIAIIAFIVLLGVKPYQKERFMCMMNPEYSKDDVCYQINQSLIAVGSGGFWGRGFGASRQKFMYLPEVGSDSIFAVIGEETGLVVGSLLLFLYGFLFYRGALVAKHASDGFGRILSIGIVTWLTLQAIINIGGMINIMPMTGVPLPFISFGGTAILSAMIGIGILLNISKQTKRHVSAR